MLSLTFSRLIFLLMISSLFFSISAQLNESKPKFWISNDMFLKDGKPFQIIGGDLHYFRVVPQYWENRLLKAKALGLNVIQTYVPWNLHMPKPGEWDFNGIADLEAYLKLAFKLDLLVMLRIGPYICAEWDFGGFPGWLLNHEPALRLRSSDSEFLKLVTVWWEVLLPKIVPLIYSNGGPVIMVQIENEYGSYGSDQEYLQFLVHLARSHLGDDVILYTTDGGAVANLDNGSVSDSDVYAAVDFSTGENAWQIFSLQKNYNDPGKSPPLTAEFYTGWLTHWGETLAVTNASFVASELDKILSRNGSAVLYMAHGGTNFGFYSGANTAEASNFEPDLTSYDYDAPIKEDGDVDNPKFRALKDVILKYNQNGVPDIPVHNNKKSYGKVNLKKHIYLFEVLDILSGSPEGFYSDIPLTMESLQQNFGFILYKSTLSFNIQHGSNLSIPLVHDRAQVYVVPQCGNNLELPLYVGSIQRWSNSPIIFSRLQSNCDCKLFVLVENMGRVNYGQFIHDRKGILSSVYLDGTAVHGWEIFSIPLNDIGLLTDSKAFKEETNLHSRMHLDSNPAISSLNNAESSKLPTFYMGSFNISSSGDIKDTYVSFHDWTKGVAFINNFNLGRFWPSRGPQCNLYVPAPLLHSGENHLIILELENPSITLSVNLVDEADYSCGQSEKGMQTIYAPKIQ